MARHLDFYSQQTDSIRNKVVVASNTEINCSDLSYYSLVSAATGDRGILHPAACRGIDGFVIVTDCYRTYSLFWWRDWNVFCYRT